MSSSESELENEYKDLEKSYIISYGKKINEENNDIIPFNWYEEIELKDRILILKEALEKKCLIINTINYNKLFTTLCGIKPVEEKENNMKKTNEKYLPIGTVVMLKNGTKRLMITGFCISTESEKNKTWDYGACLFPEGVLSSEQTSAFNHDQIERIYHLGLIDQEEIEFKQKLEEYIEHSPQIQKSNLNPNQTNTESNPTTEN